MKAFLAGAAAAILIAIAAAVVLDNFEQSSTTLYQSGQGNVRL
jgi:flagellar biosynthesis/type III secretory pathway M-ring protein FliF/YscJ